jgi:hypothetical protein
MESAQRINLKKLQYNYSASYFVILKVFQLVQHTGLLDRI